MRKLSTENMKPSSLRDQLLNRDSWKIFQIMAEFVEGFEQMVDISPSVSIFGSARFKPDHPYYVVTEELSRLLSDTGFAVVSGGGPGVMEAANKGAFAGKSASVGLNIKLPHEQSGNAFQDVGINFKYFFARKVMFVKYASAYVVMPGGFGTLDETAEILTLIQTGKSKKMHWFENTLVTEGTISATDMDLFSVTDDPEEVVRTIFDFYEGIDIDSHIRQAQLSMDI